MAKRRGLTAYRLVWKGDDVAKKATEEAETEMAELMLGAERESKGRLRPGQGVDTASMKDGLHVAEQGYNWQSDHVEPSVNHPHRGGVLVMPTKQSGGRAHGASVLELGSGQNYAIYYHQKHDPFLRIPWESAMNKFKPNVEIRWAARFD